MAYPLLATLRSVSRGGLSRDTGSELEFHRLDAIASGARAGAIPFKSCGLMASLLHEVARDFPNAVPVAHWHHSLHRVRLALELRIVLNHHVLAVWRAKQ